MSASGPSGPLVKDAKNNLFKLIKIKTVSFFLKITMIIFDHKYRINSGNLFSI